MILQQWLNVKIEFKETKRTWKWINSHIIIKFFHPLSHLQTNYVIWQQEYRHETVTPIPTEPSYPLASLWILQIIARQCKPIMLVEVESSPLTLFFLNLLVHQSYEKEFLPLTTKKLLEMVCWSVAQIKVCSKRNHVLHLLCFYLANLQTCHIC